MGRRNQSADELNLVPIMNLVTILIPFLLMSTQFVSLAAIDSAVPAIGDEEVEGSDEDEEPLGLTVDIGAAGYAISASRGDALPATTSLPCPSDCARGYDTTGLTGALQDIKDRFPEEDVVVLVPDRDVPYEVLVSTMDAARADAAGRELFPSVIIAGGLGR